MSKSAGNWAKWVGLRQTCSTKRSHTHLTNLKECHASRARTRTHRMPFCHNFKHEGVPWSLFNPKSRPSLLRGRDTLRYLRSLQAWASSRSQKHSSHTFNVKTAAPSHVVGHTSTATTVVSMTVAIICSPNGSRLLQGLIGHSVAR